MKAQFVRRNLFVAAGLALLLAASLSPRATAALLSEPATVFYGKVFAAGPNPYLLTEGQLTWVVRRADGNNLVLRSALQSLNNGDYSYRLDVPHSALASGLTVGPSEVPLGTGEESHAHLQVVVNGRPARIANGGSASFDASQARRSATYRLDLQVTLGLGDTDGNGLPDWWENRYGVADPNGDPDGDGWNNLAEFRHRSNPTNDNRIPTLVTREIRAYAEGTSAVLLRALDSDSGPSNLLYRLQRLPGTGTLSRRLSRTGVSPDAPLAVGDSFTQADVNHGRIVYVHGRAESTEPTSFEVTLQDETPTHPVLSNRVFVLFYRPVRPVSLAEVSGGSNAIPVRLPDVPSFGVSEQPFVLSYVLSRDLSYVVSDGSGQLDGVELGAPSSELTPEQYAEQSATAYGPDRRHAFVGGPGADRIFGSMESDVIVGGAGDDVLRGNGGADLFVLAGPDDGNDLIQDFNPAEDTLDISHALVGASLQLTNYLQVATTTSNTVLRINTTGTGGTYNNLALTLGGVSLSGSDVVTLVESGRIVTGSRVYASRVSLAASVPMASENGPTAGKFTLTRTGSVATELPVDLQVSGSAMNGSDYRFVPGQVTFLAGQRTLDLDITPYEDAATELNEVVLISVLPGSGYEVGSVSSAQVTIEDMMPMITVEALEPLAIKADQVGGTFLVTRSGILDRSVLVRLNIGGTAANGSDYNSISSFVNLAPYQTTALIPILPKATASLSNGVEFVQLSLRTDAAYKVGNPASARVTLIDEQLDFSLWRERFFGSAANDLSIFAAQDEGGRGIRNLHRYAFGLNPLNPDPSRGAPQFKTVDNRMTVAFRQPASVTQVQYVVEVSDDLVTWHSGEQWWEPYAAPEYANSAEMVCYRSKLAVSETPKLFMRVRVLYAP